MWMTDEELKQLDKDNRRIKAYNERMYRELPTWQKIIVHAIAWSPFVLGAIVLIIQDLKKDGIIAP